VNTWKRSALHRLFVTAVFEAMRREGLLQIELAAKAGIHPGTLSAYIRGDRTPAPPTVEKILAACGRELAIVPIGAEVPPGAADLLRLIAAELDQSVAVA
jgi:transcriptional regulator with XRE-family HTH domain